MATLTVTAKGQVTLKKDLLRHLGVRPGDKISVELMPGGKASIRAAPVSDTIAGFIGMLRDPKTKALSVDEMNAIIADGWPVAHEHHAGHQSAGAGGGAGRSGAKRAGGRTPCGKQP